MKDIFKEMEDLRTRLDELSAYAEKECKKPKMFPQEGEQYWFYGPDSGIYFNMANDSNGRLNAFRTKEEAIKARDIQWAKQRLSHAIAVKNKGWEPDWNDNEQTKSFFYFVAQEVAITYSTSSKSQPNYMYMKYKVFYVSYL